MFLILFLEFLFFLNKKRDLDDGVLVWYRGLMIMIWLGFDLWGKYRGYYLGVNLQ